MTQKGSKIFSKGTVVTLSVIGGLVALFLFASIGGLYFTFLVGAINPIETGEFKGKDFFYLHNLGDPTPRLGLYKINSQSFVSDSRTLCTIGSPKWTDIGSHEITVGMDSPKGNVFNGEGDQCVQSKTFICPEENYLISYELKNIGFKKKEPLQFYGCFKD